MYASISDYFPLHNGTRRTCNFFFSLHVTPLKSEHDDRESKSCISSRVPNTRHLVRSFIIFQSIHVHLSCSKSIIWPWCANWTRFGRSDAQRRLCWLISGSGRFFDKKTFVQLPPLGYKVIIKKLLLLLHNMKELIGWTEARHWSKY